MLDRDLSHFCGVETGALGRAVSRNVERFPTHFAFKLSEDDWDSLRCQFGVSNESRGGRRHRPRQFTQKGETMPSRLARGRNPHRRYAEGALDCQESAHPMSEPRTALDLWPLVVGLPHDEQLKLAKLALKAAASTGDDRSAYERRPPGDQEFSCEEDPLAWEGEGWEELSAPR